VVLPDNPLVQHPAIALSFNRSWRSRALTSRGFESVIPRTTILSASGWISLKAWTTPVRSSPVMQTIMETPEPSTPLWHQRPDSQDFRIQRI